VLNETVPKRCNPQQYPQHEHWARRGCEQIADSDGLCLDCGHSYRKWRRSSGLPTITLAVDQRGRFTKGPTRPKRTKGSSGYLYVQRNGKIIPEHRSIMEDALGRPLRVGENVHHVNGVRDDNRIENLELWTTSQPAGQRVADKVQWAIEILAMYAPETLSGVDPTGFKRGWSARW
jgi:HNH endonuclease